MHLDAYLAEHVDGWSRSRLQRLVENEDVLVNDRAVKSSYKLHDGDVVEVDLVEVPVARFEPENIPLDIIFEDDDLAVINKPAGMIVHPGAGVQSGTLANAIAFHFDLSEQSVEAQARGRVGIVHRLDKDTSGLIVVAKNDEVHEALSEQFRKRLVFKSYIALVHGPTEQNSGKIEAAIGRNKHNRLRMRSPAQAAVPSQSGKCVSVTPSLRCSTSRSRPAVRTRSAFIWVISITLSSATRSITRAVTTPSPTSMSAMPSSPCVAFSSTPNGFRSPTRKPASEWNLLRNCRRN